MIFLRSFENVGPGRPTRRIRSEIGLLLLPHRPIARPIGGPLEPSLYLQRFPRYSTPNVTQWFTWPWYDLWTKGQGHSFWYQ